MWLFDLNFLNVVSAWAFVLTRIYCKTVSGFSCGQPLSMVKTVFLLYHGYIFRHSLRLFILAQLCVFFTKLIILKN